MPNRFPYFSTWLSIVVFAGIVFIPFDFDLIKFQLVFTDLIFGAPIQWIGDTFFGMFLYDTKIYSDSVSMYILMLTLIVLAIFITIGIRMFKRATIYADAIFAYTYRLGIYYLALQLLHYGLDKVFKAQFYLPEPNILYTPLGQVSKDLLYWSSMGTSYGYNIFIGSVEVIAALLLLFKRTRLIGILLGIACMVQIVAINFSFDISVKLYSSFLLVIACFLIIPYIQSISAFLLKQQLVPVQTIPDIKFVKKAFPVMFLKALIIGLIFIEASFPYVKTLNFNDDTVARPFLHGAYEVKSVSAPSDSLAVNQFPIKRFFIHRNGYLIFQNQQDEMQDFNFTYDTIAKVFLVKNYQGQETLLRYQYQTKDSILSLQYFLNDKEYRLQGKSQKWQQMPAVRHSFHWTIDGGE
jgi:hypothetical protein